ncbi:unnamed protein product [Rhodiola kirilowii]
MQQAIATAVLRSSFACIQVGEHDL